MPPTLPPPELEVVKVGGSLFSWEPFPARLTAWLATRPGSRCLLIAGGGPLVRQLRAITERFGLGAEPAHWLAIRAMGVQARVLGALLAVPVFEALDDCLRYGNEATPLSTRGFGARTIAPSHRAAHCGRVAVFDARVALENDSGNTLPAGWHVTSDSIAAYVARKAGAARLVLLKSVGASVTTIDDAVACGWVDEYFPRAVGSELPVEWVNLRAVAPTAGRTAFAPAADRLLDGPDELLC